MDKEQTRLYIKLINNTYWNEVNFLILGTSYIIIIIAIIVYLLNNKQLDWSVIIFPVLYTITGYTLAFLFHFLRKK